MLDEMRKSLDGGEILGSGEAVLKYDGPDVSRRRLGKGKVLHGRSGCADGFVRHGGCALRRPTTSAASALRSLRRRARRGHPYESWCCVGMGAVSLTPASADGCAIMSSIHVDEGHARIR